MTIEISRAARWLRRAVDEGEFELRANAKGEAMKTQAVCEIYLL
jgi:hypothetical protein